MEKTMTFSRTACALGLAATVVLVLALGVRPAHAGTTFTVDRTDDTAVSTCDAATSNDCSLRGAISRANNTAGADTIDFAPGVTTLTLTISNFQNNSAVYENDNAEGDLDITDDLTIDGGSGVTIGSGTGWDERILDVIGASGAGNSNDVTLSHITIRDGHAEFGGLGTYNGGGIRTNGNAVQSNGASLTLRNSTVTDNTSAQPGGGIYDDFQSTIVLEDSTVKDNFAGRGINGFGGGISSGGPLTLTRSTISGNTGTDLGGGLALVAASTLSMTDSTVSGNTAVSSGGSTNGGGIYVGSSGNVTLTRSTVSGNTAGGSTASGSGQGGGVYADGTNVKLENTTVSGNLAQNGAQFGADGYGGGIFTGTATFTLANSTIAGNTAGVSGTGASGRGGGVYGIGAPSITIRNTIVSGNTSNISPNFGATPNSQGYNLFGENPGNLAATDIVNADPVLGPLQDNGGPTKTRALLSGSPAIDAGNPATPGSGVPACEATDQRGETRPADGDGNGTATCDIGAFEKAAGGGGGGDTTAPTVFNVDPSEGKTGVSRTTNITITFSEEMKPSSFDTNTVKLTQGSTSIPVTMTPSTDSSGRTVLTLDPFGSTTQKLGKRKTYTVTIEGANDTDGFAVEDLTGNDLAQDKVWTFKTKRR